MTTTIIEAHCNKCGGFRKHDQLFDIGTSWEEVVDSGRNSIGGTDSYYLIRCRGCEAIHLKHESTFSEDYDVDGSANVKTTYYPAALSRRKPEWLGSIHSPFWSGQSNIEISLREIYVAIQNDCRQLAAMGIRALLEVIMIEKVGDTGSIGANVRKFFAAGFVSPNDQTLFNTFLMEAGHAAMHRGFVPDRQMLETLLDLTEGLIASIYVHPHRATALQGTIPPRKP